MNQPWIYMCLPSDSPSHLPPHWLTHLKRPWCWERLKAREGDDRGWDGWMASPTQWTRVWASSGSWWWTGRPGVLQSMGLQRVRHDWVAELNWTQLINTLVINKYPSHSMVKHVAWSSSGSLGFKGIVERLEIKSKSSADFWFHRSKYCSFWSYLLRSVPHTLCVLSLF